MRKFNRRQDLSSARVVAEGIRLYRSLGYDYGVQHLLAQQIPPRLARGLLAVGFDRRERQRRSSEVGAEAQGKAEPQEELASVAEAHLPADPVDP